MTYFALPQPVFYKCFKTKVFAKKNIANHGELKRVTFWVQSFRVLPINFAIDLVTVFDAILTSRQTRLRNYSICMRIWLSNNFRRMAVLKKKMNCKLKLHFEGFYWKILRVLHALEDLEPLFLNFDEFSIHLSVRKSRENYSQIYGKSKASFKES